MSEPHVVSEPSSLDSYRRVQMLEAENAILMARCIQAEDRERRATHRVAAMEEEFNLIQVKMDDLRTQLRMATVQGQEPVERRKIWQGRRESDAV